MTFDAGFLRRLASQFGLRFGGIVLLFLQDALLINLYGKALFGQLAFFISAVQIAAMIGVLGQNNYLVFLLVRYRHRGDRARSLHALWFSVAIAAAGSLGVALLLATGTVLVSTSLNVNPGLLALGAVAVAIFEVLRQTFRVVDREDVSEGLLLVVQPLAVILATGLVWGAWGSEISHVQLLPELIYTGAMVLAALALIVYVALAEPSLPPAREDDRNAPMGKSPDWPRLYRLWFRQGLPLVFSGLFTTFQQRIDVFVLGFFVRPEVLAVYQVLSRISLIGLFVLRSVQSIFFARFARCIAHNAFAEACRLHRTATLLSLVGTVLTYLLTLPLDPLFERIFRVSLFENLLLFSFLFFARLLLAAAGGSPIFLQMTPRRASMPQFFTIAAIAFFVPLIATYLIHGTIGTLATCMALILFNGIYAALCTIEMKRYLLKN